MSLEGGLWTSHGHVPLTWGPLILRGRMHPEGGWRSTCCLMGGRLCFGPLLRISLKKIKGESSAEQKSYGRCIIDGIRKKPPPPNPTQCPREGCVKTETVKLFRDSLLPPPPPVTTTSVRQHGFSEACSCVNICTHQGRPGSQCAEMRTAAHRRGPRRAFSPQIVSFLFLGRGRDRGLGVAGG